MNTTTATLTAFLLARIAEDEDAAQAATPGPWMAATFYPDRTEVLAAHTEVADGVLARTAAKRDADGEHIARHDPARVLAECAAKRAIVGSHTAPTSGGEYDPECHVDGYGLPSPDGCPTLRALASVYADHPDYREEWRP